MTPPGMGYRSTMGHRIEPGDLVEEYGTTYADQAGITLRDKPAPLFQLLVLAMLSSTRISADVAATTAHELFRTGWRTPQRMRAATWQQRVDALGRGGYRRYDESTAEMLERLSDQLIEEQRGDLRRLRPGKDGSTKDLERALQEYPRIGPTGAAIFCREAQAVWPELRPYLDKRARDAAGRLGYGKDPERIAGLAPGGDVARLSAALVRWSLDG